MRGDEMLRLGAGQLVLREVHVELVAVEVGVVGLARRVRQAEHAVVRHHASLVRLDTRSGRGREFIRELNKYGKIKEIVLWIIVLCLNILTTRDHYHAFTCAAWAGGS